MSAGSASFRPFKLDYLSELIERVAVRLAKKEISHLPGEATGPTVLANANEKQQVPPLAEVEVDSVALGPEVELPAGWRGNFVTVIR